MTEHEYQLMMSLQRLREASRLLNDASPGRILPGCEMRTFDVAERLNLLIGYVSAAVERLRQAEPEPDVHVMDYRPAPP